MNKIRFSIIMCTYNGGERINEVVKSIINQELYDECVEEFIIVDNNSEKYTKDIIQKSILMNQKILSVEEKRQGLGNARKCGINKSNGNWIIFIDDDNILHNKWIANAFDYINKSSKRLGAFNGAVVPKADGTLTEEQKIILRSVLQGLACTHINISDINLNQKRHPYRYPFGAGLVAKSDILKQLLNEGWITSMGRNGEKLESCEDTEICLYIKKCGYSFGYNPNMVISHIINRKRLEKDYLVRLWKGFADGNYRIIKKSKYNRINIFLYLLILYLRAMKDYIKAKFSNEYALKRELNTIYRRQYFLNINQKRGG